MGRSVAKSTAGHGIGGPTNIFTSRASAQQLVQIDSIPEKLIVERAEVIDILLDEVDATQIGKVKIRSIGETGRNAGAVNYALPISTNTRVYPVIGELVATFLLDGQYYYLCPINSSNYVNNNSLNNITTSTTTTGKAKTESYKSTQQSGIPNSDSKTASDSLKIGEYILNQKVNIPLLKPQEGDIILSGRVGNYIRLGYNKDNNFSNMKCSLLSKKSNRYIAINENLDTDDCAWLVSDELLEFKKPNTQIDSVNNVPDTLNKNQIILSSGRIIFSAKTDQVLIFSKKGTHIASDGNFSSDVAGKFLANSNDTVEIKSKNASIILSSKSDTIFNAPNIYIGSKENSEPMVLGFKLAKLIEQLIDAILAETHATATGPSSVPLNASDFQLIKRNIAFILSQRNYTV